MGKIIEEKVNIFDGGIENDPRDPRANICRMVTGFDILTNPRKMTPYRNSVNGDSAAATSKKQNFCVALRTGTTYNLYSLGVVSGLGTAEVLMKSLTTGAATDLDDSSWATPANNQSSTGATSFNLFVYYKNRGLIYGARGGTAIWAFDPSSSNAWADTTHSLSYTNIAQGLVFHDDILYIPYDNKIATNNAGSWSDTALTLRTDLYITSICEYGNYLAIACAPITGIGNSVVYLWDRVSTSFNEIYDWGSGIIKILEEVDGKLVGISLSGGIGGVSRFKDRVIFRYLNGTQATKFKEIIAGGTATNIPIYKQKIDNRVHFQMSITIDGALREGVFSIGIAPSGGFSLVHERTPNNDTATTGGVVNGFFYINDFLFQSYQDNGSFALSKTNDQSVYTSSTSIRETQYYNAGDSSITKKVNGVSVQTEYLPSGAQVVLKYKKDNETSFTTIFTNTTQNSVSHEAINKETSGGALPTYKEIEWRLESSGGAEITGLSWKSEVIDKKLY